jgi:hypothetical protein
MLAEVVAQGHIGQLCLLFLYLKQARFDGVLNDQLNRGHGSCLTETVLWWQCQSSHVNGYDITYYSVHRLVFNRGVPVRENGPN